VNLALPIIRAIAEDQDDEIMMPLFLAVAERCDAVLRVPVENRDVQIKRCSGFAPVGCPCSPRWIRYRMREVVLPAWLSQE
jgi:hypothetical protein